MKLQPVTPAPADAVRRKAIYHEMQTILFEEVPMISPVGRKNMLIHRPNVHGLRNHSQFWSIRFDGIWKS